MADFLPHDIRPGDTGDGAKVQENFEAVEDKFPLSADDIGGLKSSVINWDVDPPTTTTLIPGADPQNFRVLSGTRTLRSLRPWARSTRPSIT
jgi:hypothetical protein